MKIGIAADHGGYKVKDKIKKILDDMTYSYVDYGTNSEERVDFPDFAFKLGQGFNNKEFDLGIAICSSGIGMTIACNKVKSVRCAKVNNVDDVIHAKERDYANFIALGNNIKDKELNQIIKEFIERKPLDDLTYKKRKEKIEKYEENK